MTYWELQEKIGRAVFTLLDVGKFFPQEQAQTIRVQLCRLNRKGLIKKLRRGVYCFSNRQFDELEVAWHLYQPSYISLETALHYHGMIPDIPLCVTSVTTITTKKFTTDFGAFYFQKIKPELFFGYTIGNFNLAFPEKALLDYFYIRKKRKIDDLRLDISRVNLVVYRKFAAQFPGWVQEINL